MKQRIKITGLVSHTTPTKSIMSEESKLRSKFEKGVITSDELRRYTSFVMIVKKQKPTEVRIFGIWKSIAKLGLDVDTLIKQGYTLR